METHLATSHILPRRRWFRSQIHRKRSCATPHQCTQKWLQTWTWLARQNILRHHPRLKLLWTMGGNNYAWLHQKIPAQVPISNSNWISLCPPQTHSHCVRGITTTHIKWRIKKTRRRNQTSSKHLQHINLLSTLCWINVSRGTQKNCIRTGECNRRNKSSMSPTPRLRCLSWQCYNTIHCTWHDSCITLWRILPLGKTSTESSRRTLLPNKPRRRNIQQWRCAHHLLHNRTYIGISFRSWTVCHVLQFPQSHSSPYNIRKNGPSATPHQHHCW